MAESGQDLFKIEKIALKFVGINLAPKDSALYRIYSLICITLFIFFYPVVLLTDLLRHKFVDALEAWTTFISFAMVLAMVLTTFHNRLRIGDLMNRLGQKPFISDVHKEEIQKWQRFKNAQTLVLVIAMVLTLAGQIVISLVLRLTKADPNDWKLGYGRITIMNITYSPNFEIFYVYQSISVIYAMVSYTVVVILITGVFDYIATQFRILQVILTTMVDKPKQEKQMKDFLEYHVQVLKAVDEVIAVFSETILCTFVGLIAAICLNVYSASLLPLQDVNTFIVLLQAFVGSFGTILICTAGENLTRESVQVSAYAYGTDFIDADLSVQRSLMLIMRKSQQPIRLKAGKLIDISLVTFTLIMRASYSLYAVLTTTNKNV